MNEEEKQQLRELIKGLEVSIDLRMVEKEQTFISNQMNELGFQDLELLLAGCKWRLMRIPE
tara:strand:- start:157 stop:339 length:183 start_codon:yes stop_codon:yes gene_type:complete